MLMSRSKRNSHARSLLSVIVLMLVSALSAPFLLAASTGVVVSPATQIAHESERVKFIASTLYSEVVTEGTTIVVDDDGSGLFYNGNISSGCSPTATPVTTKRFSIEKNKAFCYSNQTPGIYSITVQLQDGDGAPLGGPVVVEVTVQASTTEPVDPETDIAITKTVANERPRVNERVSYTITVTNLGTTTATTIVVEDVLPVEIQYVSASPAPVASSPLRWEKVALVPGETFVISLEGEVGNESAGLTVINTATVISDTNDSNPANNTASAPLYPQVASEQESDTYQLEGYVWHDANQNEDNDGEEGLWGWSVTASLGTTTVEAVTDETGKYSLMVTPGTWVITSEVLPGWERTTPESYVVVVPAEDSEEVSKWVEWWKYIVPTAEAALVATYGGYDFGLLLIPSFPPTEEKQPRGKSSATRVKKPTADILPLARDHTAALIAAEQVTLLPVGAPATGHGGAASRADSLLLHHLLYREARRSSWYEL